VITVTFRRRAFNRMNGIIRKHPNRVAEFAAALQEMHRALTAAPDSIGESRDPPYRVWFFGPLTVEFRHAPTERRVYVVKIRLRGDP